MHAVAAGADDYLMNPFSMTVLLAKVQALLRRNRQEGNATQVEWDNNYFNTPLTRCKTNAARSS